MGHKDNSIIEGNERLSITQTEHAEAGYRDRRGTRRGPVKLTAVQKINLGPNKGMCATGHMKRMQRIANGKANAMSNKTERKPKRSVAEQFEALREEQNFNS